MKCVQPPWCQLSLDTFVVTVHKTERSFSFRQRLCDNRLAQNGFVFPSHFKKSECVQMTSF